MVTDNPHNEHDYTHDENEEHYIEPEVESGLSPVAAAPGKNILIMVVIAIVIIAAVYYSFFAETPQEKAKKTAQQTASVAAPKVPPTKLAAPEAAPAPAPVMPSLPEPPPLVAPTPPAPPPPPTVQAPAPLMAPLPFINNKKDEEARTRAEEEAQRKEFMAEEAKRKAHRNSTMMLSGGGTGGSEDSSKDKSSQDKTKITDLVGGSGTSDDDFDMAHTGASQVKATRIGRTASMIAQGKLIDAVLETAINTDLPGSLRAVVSRDVYAEAGQTILIPKGSRLIGTYQAAVQRGQRRVNIIWSRLIRPDGIDIAIDSPATDQLGRTGLDGDVDNRYQELFSSAILLSTISTGFAIVANKVSNTQNASSTSTSTGSTGTTTTTTSSPTAVAIGNSVNQMGGITQGISQDYLDINPTITVDQGTKIIVYVNHDLVFPATIANPVKLLQ